MAGFDTGYSGTILQMASFNKAFGHCVPGPTGTPVCRLSATQQSLTFISALFIALGCGVSGIVSNLIGRKKTLQLGCIIVCAGAAGQLGIQSNYTSFMACKCIAAFGIGPFQVAAPMYGVECMAPHRRGALFSMYGIGLSLGSLVVASVCLGSSKIETNWSWKTPIVCQILIYIAYMTLIWTFPESPRWLLMKGKVEEARRSFGRFYALEPHSEDINAQIEDTQTSIDFENSISSTSLWTEIFHRNYARRTIILIIVLTSSSICGTWFVVPYAAVFFADVGMKSPFVINVAFSACLFSGALISPFVVEILGRRMSMLIGYTILASCMLIFSTVSSGLGITRKVAEHVLVAFLCLWGFFFGGFISSSTWLSSSEVHSVRLRAHGQGFAALVTQIIAFACSFWTPYMLNVEYGNMGTNVGYFYFGITVALIILVYSLYPETGQLTLEQIDDIFASKIRPWKTSMRRNRRIAKGEISDMSSEARYNQIQQRPKI